MMNTKYSKIALLLATATSLTLAGCGGDDGKDGKPGNPGTEPADAIQVLNLDVTNVTYDNGTPTVTVFATNQDDLPVIGLQDLGIVAAQLTPMGATGAGNSAQWTRTARASGTSSYTDNKNGQYTFTLELSEYNPELTQRLNVYAGGVGSTLMDGVTTVPRREIVKDYSGDGYEAIYTKNIVSHQTCTSCHAEDKPLTSRHSNYFTQETCATCHSSSMSMEKQWNHLIHNIHNTSKTFVDRYGKEYTGVAAEALIQNNCQTCHVESEELSEWNNWSRIPTMETCTSCHTNIDFKAGQGHSQQLDNSNCIACHNASWTEELHTGDFVQKKAFIDMYGMSATLVANKADDADLSATLTVSILNANGQALDANTLITKIQRLETITNVGPNFPIMGYNPNPESGLAKIVKDLVSKGALVDGVTVNGDGQLQFVFPSLPFGAGDTDTAFTFIGLEMCNDGVAAIDCAEGVATTSMKAELTHGTYSGDAPSYRHVDSVNFSTCQNCHGETFELHKGHHAGFVMTEQLSHTNNADGQPIIGVDACVACHTPDGTYASGGNKGAFETKLHVVHGEQDIIKDCTQCHNDFNLDAFKVKGALATDNPNYSGSLYTTPITATCASCHGFDEIKNHAQSQGAVVNGSYQEANDAAQLETCFFCHAPSIENHGQIKM
ncbi:OmcA/MtrC family decaheme c-type cytochrome [Shewanella aestuarii]|uniref:OmcA/MtrC family decaheme c-type cytochrome n=1 Tax=Shewanella aestuarii TaxID=1028752 RepID=A0A6G9QJ82_9GAMM|nr:OmcA/MtrC family decaheme c-type cytochrome [Shewanella aestuarii]QIR14125.1 OmcA/MtrC family decaheme c-type cytochrome [Shewanella aestuarii]